MTDGMGNLCWGFTCFGHHNWEESKAQIWEIMEILIDFFCFLVKREAKSSLGRRGWEFEKSITYEMAVSEKMLKGYQEGSI